MGTYIGYTCTTIDKIISQIKSARRTAETWANKVDQNAGGDEFSDIANDLYRLEDMLEEVREANIQLRQGMVDAVSDLERLQELMSQ